MELQQISPDQNVIWQWEFIKLNATIAYTWLVMFILTAVSWFITRNLTVEGPISRWQNLLEVIVDTVKSEITSLTDKQPTRYLPFISTLFIFIAFSNILDVAPGFTSPAASLSTTAALAACVFGAVPAYAISDQGVIDYLRRFAQPSILMLPFNIIGEVSRTLALAIRLFGNVMSTGKIAAILLAVAPLFFPIIMHALGLLTGLIQAYIFAVLTMVYIASASRAQAERSGNDE